MAWLHDVVSSVFVKVAVVKIQSVLRSRLTNAPTVGTWRHPTDHEVLIRTHLDDVEGVNEVFQIPQGA
jgi:hypothetical protein